MLHLKYKYDDIYIYMYCHIFSIYSRYITIYFIDTPKHAIYIYNENTVLSKNENKFIRK